MHATGQENPWNWICTRRTRPTRTRSTASSGMPPAATTRRTPSDARNRQKPGCEIREVDQAHLFIHSEKRMQTHDLNQLLPEHEKSGRAWLEFLRVPSLSMG